MIAIGPFRPHAVRLLQVAMATGSRNPGTAASAQCFAASRAASSAFALGRSCPVHWLYRCCPRILKAISIFRPETVVRWHRTGFTAYWRWKSRPLGGRPRIGKEVRDLIRRMSFENPLWDWYSLL